MEPYFVTIMRDRLEKREFNYVINSLLKHPVKYDIECIINEFGHILLKHAKDNKELMLLTNKFKEVHLTNINVLSTLCELDADSKICEEILEHIMYKVTETPYVAISNRHPEITSTQTFTDYTVITSTLNRIVQLDCFSELLDKITKDSIIHNIFSSSIIPDLPPEVAACIIAKRINTLDDEIHIRHKTNLSKEVTMYLIQLVSTDKIIGLVTSDPINLENYLSIVLRSRKYDTDLILKLLHSKVKRQAFRQSFTLIVFDCVRYSLILAKSILKEETILLWLPDWEPHMKKEQHVPVNVKYQRVITYLNYIGKLEVILTDDKYN